jgi:hypothetical protein
MATAKTSRFCALQHGFDDAFDTRLAQLVGKLVQVGVAAQYQTLQQIFDIVWREVTQPEKCAFDINVNVN